MAIRANTQAIANNPNRTADVNAVYTRCFIHSRGADFCFANEAQTPSSEFQVSSNEFWISADAFQVSSNEVQISANEDQALVDVYQVSSNVFWVSADAYQTLSGEDQAFADAYQVPSNAFWVSADAFQASSNAYQTSANVYQTPSNDDHVLYFSKLTAICRVLTMRFLSYLCNHYSAFRCFFTRFPFVYFGVEGMLFSKACSFSIYDVK